MSIRKSIFETNSSSSHSISLGNVFIRFKKPIFLKLIDDVTHTIKIYPGEFGWEQEEYTDELTKASYALTYAKNYGTKKQLDMLQEVIAAETNCQVLLCSIPDKFCPDGYIDHQSVDTAANIFKDKKTLRNFIFNINSVLRTDNDNHD